MNAERAVIGSCLVSDTAVEEATTLLSADDFSSPNLATIFAGILSLHGKGSKVAVDTVCLELGLAYDSTMGMEVLDLAGESTLGVSAAVKKVADDSMRRRMILKAVELRASAEQGHDINELLHDAQGLVDLTPRSEAKTIEQIAAEHLPAMQNKRDYYHLDPWGIRLRAGTVTIVGARPGVGKSAFGLQSAQELAERHVKTRIYSYEMSDEDWVERVIARNAGLTTEQIDDGINEAWMQQVKHQMGADWTRFVTVLDCIGWPLQRVMSDMRRFARQGGKVAVIDYLQLMVAQTYEDVTEASRLLKVAARQSGLALVVLSQLKRTDKDGKPRPPAISDLRQSGALEQDADIVALLHIYERKDSEIRVALQKRGYLLEHEDRKMLGHVNIAKNRRGKPSYTVPAWFDGEEMRWTDVNQTSNERGL